MVRKPGMNEIECVRVGADKISKLFLRKICAISEKEQHKSLKA